MSQLLLISTDALRTHEAVDDTQVARVMASMRESGKFYPPLLVDQKTNVILDGHHRYWACRRLGCKRIPCYVIDYMNDGDVVLKSWRPDVTVTKQQVIEMAMSNRVFPQKTTRHIYSMPDSEPVPMTELFR